MLFQNTIILLIGKKKNPGSNNQKNAEGSGEQCTHIQYVRVNICVVCFLFVLLRVDVIAKKKNAFTSNTVGFLLQYYFLWLIFIFTVVIFQLYYLLVTFYNIGGDTSERSDRFSSSRSLSFLWSVSPPKPPAVSTLHFLPLWTDRKREPETHSNTTGGHVHRNEWHPDMLQYVSAFAMPNLKNPPKMKRF